MWQITRPYLFALSVGLNLSFVAMWIAHAAPTGASSGSMPSAGESPIVWCPLHRELKVTDEQWQQIEPRLRQFQADVDELSQRVDGMRAEVIDMLAGSDPDPESIRVKQDEILAAKRQMQDMVAAHLLAEKQILSDQQRQQLFRKLRERTGCAANPPMSGRSGRPGMGQWFREGHRDTP